MNDTRPMDEQPPSHAPSPRAPAFIFVFITVLLDMLAIGMIVPVLPRLVVDFLSGDTARAAQIFGLFGAAWALMQFVFSPVQGALSDRFGRRPVILLSNFGLGLDYIFMALAPNLIWLFVGRPDLRHHLRQHLDRLCVYRRRDAGREARRALRPARRRFRRRLRARPRARRPGRQHLAAAAVLDRGGPEPRQCALRLPGAAGIARRGAARPVGVAAGQPVRCAPLLASQPQLGGLAAVSFLGNLAHASLPSISVLYMQYRYGFDERMVGFTLAAVGLCTMVVQGGLIGRTVRRFGERTTLIMGLGFGIAGFALFGLAPTGALFWGGIPLMSLWGFASPSALGLMSRRVSASEQGRLQGANSSLMGVANMLGPALFGQVLALSIGAGSAWQLPGAAFLLAAALLVAAAIVALSASRRRRAIAARNGPRRGRPRSAKHGVLSIGPRMVRVVAAP